MLSRKFSAVICTGAVPLLVTVTTLVTGVRSVGIVKARVRTPAMVASVPLVAEVKVTVPTFTVNVTVLLVPAGVVTLTVLAERVAVFEIVKVVVTVVEVTVKAPTVIPVPDTFTAVAPVRFVPVKVTGTMVRSEEHTSELQSQSNLVCRLLLEKKKETTYQGHCFHSK